MWTGSAGQVLGRGFMGCTSREAAPLITAGAGTLPCMHTQCMGKFGSARNLRGILKGAHPQGCPPLEGASQVPAEPYMPTSHLTFSLTDSYSANM